MIWKEESNQRLVWFFFFCIVDGTIFTKNYKKAFCFGTLYKKAKRYTIQKIDEKNSLIQIDNEKKLY